MARGQGEASSDASGRLTISRLRPRAVNPPLPTPHPTAGGNLTSAPLVLLDLETREGLVGRAYVFVYTPMMLAPVVSLVQSLGEVLAGTSAAPTAIERSLQTRFRLLGPQGLTGMVMALIDMAAWDALGQATGLPLYALLGEMRRPIPAYHSLGMGGVETAVREAEASAALGFKTIKLKVGYPSVAEDIEAVRAAKVTIGTQVRAMVDYNQSLTVPEAIARCGALRDEALLWVEEPVSHRDLAGMAKVAREAALPIQAGENWWGVPDMVHSIAAGASDHAMLDVMKIGGVTGWMRAAALADAHALPVSSHLFPEVSAHLLAATPTAQFLEWQDWAEAILVEPVRPEAGFVTPLERPGIGLMWDEAAVGRYAAD